MKYYVAVLVVTRLRGRVVLTHLSLSLSRATVLLYHYLERASGRSGTVQVQYVRKREHWT